MQYRYNIHAIPRNRVRLLQTGYKPGKPLERPGEDSEDKVDGGGDGKDVQDKLMMKMMMMVAMGMTVMMGCQYIQCILFVEGGFSPSEHLARW